MILTDAERQRIIEESKASLEPIAPHEPSTSAEVYDFRKTVPIAPPPPAKPAPRLDPISESIVQKMAADTAKALDGKIDDHHEFIMRILEELVGDIWDEFAALRKEIVQARIEAGIAKGLRDHDLAQKKSDE